MSRKYPIMESYLNNKIKQIENRIETFDCSIIDNADHAAMVDELRNQIFQVKKTLYLQRDINKFAYEVDHLNEDDDLPQFIIQSAQKLFNCKFGVLSEFDDEKLEFRMIKNSHENALAKWINGILPFKLPEMTISVDKEEYQSILNNKVAYFNSVFEISKHKIPESISNEIDEFLQPGWMASLALISDCRVFGSLILFAHKGQNLIERENLISFASIAANAIKRKHLRQLHLKSKANLNAILENTDNIIWAIDKENKISYTNSRFREIVSKINDAEWSIGQDFFNHIPEAEVRFWVNVINRASENKQFIIRKTYVIDNHEKTFQISVNPIEKNGTIIGTSFFASDLTLEKRNIQLEHELHLAKKTMELKQNFLANMSHELRTPLTGILGVAELMKHTTLDPTQKEYLEMLTDSGMNLKELIELILDYSNIKTKVWDSALADFSLLRLMGKKIGELSANSKKNIRFSYKHDNQIPESILADETLISKILDNLLENAYKYTEKGSITLSSELISDRMFLGLHKIPEALPGELWIKINITDTGKGINNYVKEHIFKPFMNLEQKHTREIDGTGLGLALCKEIIDFMGGKIGYESSVNSGSMFWFLIKVRKGKMKNTAIVNQQTYPQEESNESYKNLKAGYIYNGSFNAKITQIAFKHVGMNIHTMDITDKNVNNKILKGNFDVIVFDLHDVENTDFVKKIQSAFNSDPFAPEMAVVVSRNEKVLPVSDLHQSIGYFIEKPFNTKALAGILKSICKKRCNQTL